MQLDFKFEAGNEKESEVNGIWDSAIYAKKSASQLLGLYYLMLWKGYPAEENTWEPALVIQHLWRLVTAYHKDNLKKLTATSAPIDTAPPIARSTMVLTKKRGQLTGLTTAPTKKVADLLNPLPSTSRQKSPRSFLTQSLFGFPPKKYPICRLRSFSPITLHGSFGFLPQYFHWIRRFFIDRSCIFLIVLLRAKSMILRNLIFSPHLFIW